MAKRIYIETTIPSFYFESRSAPDMVARREWTRSWWRDAAAKYELVTSVAVLEEIAQDVFPAREECLELIMALPLVPIDPAVTEIVETNIARKVMPASPVGDALHLAVASYHRCDFLLTWNCRHLANANKFDHIRRVNSMLGIFVPALVTPLNSWGTTMPTEHKDEGIQAVRDVREKISAAYENDPERIVTHYLTEQDRYKDRLLKPLLTASPPSG